MIFSKPYNGYRSRRKDKAARRKKKPPDQSSGNAIALCDIVNLCGLGLTQVDRLVRTRRAIRVYRSGRICYVFL